MKLKLSEILGLAPKEYVAIVQCVSVAKTFILSSNVPAYAPEAPESQCGWIGLMHVKLVDDWLVDYEGDWRDSLVTRMDLDKIKLQCDNCEKQIESYSSTALRLDGEKEIIVGYCSDCDPEKYEG
jgi:hypothetical protein